MHGIRDCHLHGNHGSEGSELRMVIGIDVVVMIAWAVCIILLAYGIPVMRGKDRDYAEHCMLVAFNSCVAMIVMYCLLCAVLNSL